MGATPIALASFSTTSYTYSPLLSDGDDITSRPGTVASGIGVLKRGAIVKIDPPTGAITIPVAATDANAIIVNDVDATAATVAAQVYLTGRFKADAVIWPGALGHAAVTDALRNYGIILESVVFTDGTLVKSVPKMAEAANAMAQVEQNRAALEKQQEEARKMDPSAPVQEAEREKLASDSLWGYLTPEEQALHPELATPGGLEKPTAPPAGGIKPPEGGGTPPAGSGVSLSPTSATVLASGGTGSIAVMATGAWTVGAPPAWVTCSPMTGSGNGTVTYTGATNTTGQPRQALIDISGQKFTLNQGAV